MAVMRMLEFGSGFDHLLASSDQKGARDVTQMGVIGLHMSGSSLDTAALQDFNHQQLMTLFKLDSHVEEASGIPGVTMSKPGPLSEWAHRLVRAMNTAGEALASEGCSSLGEFVLDCLKDCTAKQKPPSAVYLVRELAESVPSFADAAPSPHGTIAFSRKASLLAADLYLRFRSENAQLFDFCDMAALPADSGAYALAQLRARGAVECGQACASSIASGEEVSSGARERALRCAAVLAGKGVAAEVGVQPWQLCRWLQQQLDRRADADLVVHSNRATDAY